MVKRDKPSISDYRSLSRLAIYIIVGGWILLLIYFLIFYEYGGNTKAFSRIVDYFLSPDQFGIRFRALVFFAPFIASVIGYLVYEKAKMLKKTILLMEQYEHLSKTDALTGLWNRRALFNSLEYEIERVKRYESSFSLFLCDLDNLKTINDSSGHEFGDRALKIASEVINNSIRKTDILGRYGGDEFLVILPETTTEQAKILAERVCTSLRNFDFKLLSGELLQLTLSVGITNFSPATDNIGTLIKRADNALYASKYAGGDKVVAIGQKKSPTDTPDSEQKRNSKLKSQKSKLEKRKKLKTQKSKVKTEEENSK